MLHRPSIKYDAEMKNEHGSTAVQSRSLVALDMADGLHRLLR